MREPCHSMGFDASGGKWAQTRGTNPVPERRGLVDAGSTLGTFRAMDESTSPEGRAGQTSVVVDLDGIQIRYGIGKTKATELVAAEGFPNSVVPGMHRYPLTALERWEVAHALAGTIAEPSPPQGPVVLAPPAPGRPGRRPGSTREAA